jgi:TonB family protein
MRRHAGVRPRLRRSPDAPQPETIGDRRRAARVDAAVAGAVEGTRIAARGASGVESRGDDDDDAAAEDRGAASGQAGIAAAGAMTAGRVSAGEGSGGVAADEGDRGAGGRGGGGSGSGGDLRASCAVCPSPEYPARARRQGWEGTVDVALRVGTDGAVEQAQVGRSSGFAALDAAAVAVARRSRFHVVERSGLRGSLRYRFVLENARAGSF